VAHHSMLGQLAQEFTHGGIGGMEQPGLAFCSFFFSIFFFLCINILTSSLFAIVCIWIMHGCYCCIELIVLSGYIYQCFRFVLPLPDRNRRVPVRNIPFSISRNTGFVFPSGLPVPVSVPDKKIQEREWLRHFPDRSRPFSSLDAPQKPDQWPSPKQMNTEDGFGFEGLLSLYN